MQNSIDFILILFVACLRKIQIFMFQLKYWNEFGITASKYKKWHLYVRMLVCKTQKYWISGHPLASYSLRKQICAPIRKNDENMKQKRKVNHGCPEHSSSQSAVW